MENKANRDYSPKDNNPQQQSQKHESQLNRDDNKAKNAKNANANSQHSPENGRDSNVPSSISGSDKVNQVDIEIGKRLEHQDAENTNKVPNPDNRIPNPDESADKKKNTGK